MGKRGGRREHYIAKVLREVRVLSRREFSVVTDGAQVWRRVSSEWIERIGQLGDYKQSTFFWDQRRRRQIVGWAGSNAEVKMKKVVDCCLEMFKVEEKEKR